MDKNKDHNNYGRKIYFDQTEYRIVKKIQQGNTKENNPNYLKSSIIKEWQQFVITMNQDGTNTSNEHGREAGSSFDRR